MRDKIIAGMFFVIVFYTAVCSGFYNIIIDAAKSTAHHVFSSAAPDGENKLSSVLSDSLSSANSSMLDALPYKTAMVELNGSLLKKAGTRSFYNISDKMNITTNGYNIGRYDQTSTDYETGQTVAFKKYLDTKGIALLYVSEPAKYTDDNFYTSQFGGESYLNRNTDLFLKRIRKAGVHYLDLRDCISEENIDPLQMFYRTDHHWTVPASKWAASKIAEELNTGYGYHIDLSLYSDSAFHSVTYQDAWLGEQGKKVSKSYIGLDDYTMLEPSYETSYRIIGKDGSVKKEGDFGIFIDKSVYQSEADYYSAPSWHYSYNDFTGKTIHNDLADQGNILILGDSYEASMAPFLSLGIRDITVIVPRTLSSSVREYIEKGNYDTVIIAYTQFMLGAHDDRSNANYRMFALD